ncbi:SdpI family protein [uncultured Faecalibaculum sp.]|uniref:SdpI family protein n=1 Tax=uncultured Faecalibaculum sp. TaxID=1729681 RepID=UPI00262DF97B|nr:SdpI family protein [uncultured Faecalibaculum sp.]
MKQQFQTYRKELIAESLILLLPSLAGLVLPGSRSDLLRLEWQWFLPAFNLAVCWDTFLIAAALPSCGTLPPKTLTSFFQLLTVFQTAICLIMMALDYGSQFNVMTLVNGITALLFLLIGNLLPKTGPNSIVGIRTSWALQSEDCWNHTQRQSGKLLVFCSLIMLLCCFMPVWQPLALYWTALTAALAGSVWISWNYAKNHPATPAASLQNPQEKKAEKTAAIITTVLLLFVVLSVGALIALSDYQVEFLPDRLVLDASTASDASVQYAQIRSMDLVNPEDPQAAAGSKVIGYNGFGLEMGTFDNSLYGRYQRYVRGDGPVIVIRSKQETIVFSGRNAGETREMFEELESRVRNAVH